MFQALRDIFEGIPKGIPEETPKDTPGGICVGICGFSELTKHKFNQIRLLYGVSDVTLQSFLN